MIALDTSLSPVCQSWICKFSFISSRDSTFESSFELFHCVDEHYFFQDELYSVIVFASAEDDFCMARGSSAFSASSDQKPSLRGHCNSCYLVLLALSIHTPEEKQNSDVEQFT